MAAGTGGAKASAAEAPGEIILLEAKAEKATRLGLESIRSSISKGGRAIVISASRPYKSLMESYRGAGIDGRKVMVIDCVSKPNNAEIEEAENVLYLESSSDLTDILLSVKGALESGSGKRSLFLDSITTMLIYNKPDIYAKFIHNLLTMMRMKGVGGTLLFISEGAEQEVRAEIVQLCDKVVRA